MGAGLASGAVALADIGSSAKSEFKTGITVRGQPKSPIGLLPHEPYRHHQPIPTDLRDQPQRRIDAQAQQLVLPPFLGIVLKMPIGRSHHVGMPRIAQQAQHELQG